MPASDVPWLGPRIREERLKRGLSLRGLARDVGVSASMISQIETAKSQPSVSTLYAITNALAVSIEDLFAVSDGAEPAATPRPRAVQQQNGAPTTVLEALGSFAGDRLGPVVRSEHRPVLNLDSGVTWELLGKLPHHAVDFLLITYAPGGTSSSRGGLMRHPGSEYGYLLSGELTVTLGFEQSTLRAGESISFDSTTPHSYRNDGAAPAVGVWFVVEYDR
jgi:transcriptional regulator with XRE-family HTH domain/mannose-6-phosphate isomerase-like protein (cupin superfamily)